MPHWLRYTQYNRGLYTRLVGFTPHVAGSICPKWVSHLQVTLLPPSIKYISGTFPKLWPPLSPLLGYLLGTSDGPGRVRVSSMGEEASSLSHQRNASRVEGVPGWYPLLWHTLFQRFPRPSLSRSRVRVKRQSSVLGQGAQFSGSVYIRDHFIINPYSILYTLVVAGLFQRPPFLYLNLTVYRSFYIILYPQEHSSLYTLYY